jgi:hypothetical protein
MTSNDCTASNAFTDFQIFNHPQLVDKKVVLVFQNGSCADPLNEIQATGGFDE